MAKTKKSGEAKQSELPKTLKRSSDKAQRTFTKTYDAAIKEYKGDEERAYRTAYASLEKKYEKVDGKWKRKKDDDETKKSEGKKSDKKSEKKADSKEKSKKKDSKPKEVKAKDKDSKKDKEKSEKKSKKFDDKKTKAKSSKDSKKDEKKIEKKADKKAEKKSDKKIEKKSDKSKDKKSDKKKDSKKSDKSASKAKKNKAEKSLSLKDEEYLESEPSLLETRNIKSEIDDFMEEDVVDENLYGSAEADVDPAPALEILRDVEDLQDSAYVEEELSTEDERLIEELSDQEAQQSKQESQTTAFEVPGSSSSLTPENTTKRELYAQAVELKIAGRSTMNKEQLLSAVQKARA